MRLSKLIAATVGVIMAVASLALAVAGGIAIAVPDDDGWVSAGPVRLQSEAAALIADDVEIDFGGGVSEGRTYITWGEIPAVIDLTSRNGKDVFVGIASQSAADNYLLGVAQDRLSSLDHEDNITFVPGVFRVDPPTETDIWVASSVDGTLDWDVQSGEWAIVVANSDGSAGIDVGVEAAAKVSFLRPLGAFLLAAGIVGMITGSVLTYFGVRRTRDNRGRPASLTPPAPEPISAG